MFSLVNIGVLSFLLGLFSSKKERNGGTHTSSVALPKFTPSYSQSVPLISHRNKGVGSVDGAHNSLLLANSLTITCMRPFLFLIRLFLCFFFFFYIRYLRCSQTVVFVVVRFGGSVFPCARSTVL